MWNSLHFWKCLNVAAKDWRSLLQLPLLFSSTNKNTHKKTQLLRRMVILEQKPNAFQIFHFCLFYHSYISEELKAICFYPRWCVIEEDLQDKFLDRYISHMFLASILLIKNNIYANSIEKSTLRTTFLSIPLKPPYVPALHTAGKELVFFIVSGMMLCFGFWRKTMLIAHWCFRCRWAVLYRNKDASVSCTAMTVWGTEWAQGAGRGRN